MALSGRSKTIIKNSTMDTADAFLVEKIKELFRQSSSEWVGGGGVL